MAKETLIFREFLEENGIDWSEFLDNCEAQNQRWHMAGNYYDFIEDLQVHNAEDWLIEAFSWSGSRFSAEGLSDTHEKWGDAVMLAKREGVEIMFGGVSC